MEHSIIYGENSQGHKCAWNTSIRNNMLAIGTRSWSIVYALVQNAHNQNKDTKFIIADLNGMCDTPIDSNVLGTTQSTDGTEWVLSFLREEMKARYKLPYQVVPKLIFSMRGIEKLPKEHLEYFRFILNHGAQVGIHSVVMTDEYRKIPQELSRDFQETITLGATNHDLKILGLANNSDQRKIQGFSEKFTLSLHSLL